MTSITDITIDQNKKKGQTCICRVVFIEKLADLDINNLGCHFSSKLSYVHSGGGSNGTTRSAQLKVTFYALVGKSNINEDATADSNTEYPKECEVVCMPKQQISIEIKVQKRTELGWLRADEFYKASANTGLRYDKWVEEYL